MSYVYIQSERAGQKISEGNYFEHSLWTVGFYTPDGKWEPESDFSTSKEAAERCHYPEWRKTVTLNLTRQESNTATP